MKFLFIGDPHGNLGKVKNIPKRNVDQIILTGDLGKATFARQRFFDNVERRKNNLPDLKSDAKHSKNVYMEIYNSSMDILKYCSNIVPTYSILGNVGMNMVKNPWVRKEQEKWNIKLPSFRDSMSSLNDFNFVRNRVRNIGGIRVGFLEYFVDNCWIKEFREKKKDAISKAKKETTQAKRVLDNFGKVDVLICHQPPYGFLDKVGAPAPKMWRGKHTGSKIILNYIKKYKPKYVFCGHIHEGEGKAQIGKTEVYNLGVWGYKTLDL